MVFTFSETSLLKKTSAVMINKRCCKEVYHIWVIKEWPTKYWSSRNDLPYMGHQEMTYHVWVINEWPTIYGSSRNYLPYAQTWDSACGSYICCSRTDTAAALHGISATKKTTVYNRWKVWCFLREHYWPVIQPIGKTPSIQGRLCKNKIAQTTKSAYWKNTKYKKSGVHE